MIFRRSSLALLSAFSLNLPLSVLGADGPFTYDGEKGTDNWAILTDIPNNDCGGMKQSPIDLSRKNTECDASMSRADAYTFTRGTCTYDDITFTVNPASLNGNYPLDGTCDLDKLTVPHENAKGKEFELIQFHMHTGTEHTFDGEMYGAELHLVHKLISNNSTAPAEYAVVGIKYDYTQQVAPVPEMEDLEYAWLLAERDTIQKCANCPSRRDLGDKASEKMRKMARLTGSFDGAHGLIPEDAGIFTYEGSFTTPPCTEAVYWNVVDGVVPLTIGQYADMINLILKYVDPDTCEPASVASEVGITSRPPQPLNNRTVKLFCATP